MMGDMADSGRLPGAMKFASEGCGVTKLDLYASNATSCSVAMIAAFKNSNRSSA
jgi:hypothetical protein